MNTVRKRGFTLIEVMVATLLLTMLVTILTMIFNQSSIAWSAGLASVAGIGRAREDISIYSQEAEAAVLSDDGTEVLRVTSLFDAGTANLRAAGRTLATDFERLNVSPTELRDPLTTDKTFSIGGAGAAGRDTYLVGVVSYGPDRKTGGDYSWDDISTLPEEIVK